MGTKNMSLYRPTDAYVDVVTRVYVDLEDVGVYLTDQALSEANANGYSVTSSDLDSAICDAAAEIAEGDHQSSSIHEVEWNWRTIEVCEWCESPSCDGDPDYCGSAPEFCSDCEIEVDNCTCDEEEEIVEPIFNKDSFFINTKTGAATHIEYGPEEETVL